MVVPSPNTSKTTQFLHLDFAAPEEVSALFSNAAPEERFQRFLSYARDELERSSAMHDLERARQAVQLLEDAQVFAKRELAHDAASEAEVVGLIGRYLYAQDETFEALAYLERYIELQGFPEPVGSADAALFEYLIECLELSCMESKAVVYLEKYLEALDQLPVSAASVKYTLKLASLCSDLQEGKREATLIARSARLLHKLHDPPNELVCELALAKARAAVCSLVFDSKKLEEATNYYLALIELKDRLTDDQRYDCLVLGAWVEFFSSDFNSAFARFEEAFSIIPYNNSRFCKLLSSYASFLCALELYEIKFEWPEGEQAYPKSAAEALQRRAKIISGRFGSDHPQMLEQKVREVDFLTRLYEHSNAADLASETVKKFGEKFAETHPDQLFELYALISTVRLNYCSTKEAVNAADQILQLLPQVRIIDPETIVRRSLRAACILQQLKNGRSVTETLDYLAEKVLENPQNAAWNKVARAFVALAEGALEISDSNRTQLFLNQASRIFAVHCPEDQQLGYQIALRSALHTKTIKNFVSEYVTKFETNESYQFWLRSEIANFLSSQSLIVAAELIEVLPGSNQETNDLTQEVIAALLVYHQNLPIAEQLSELLISEQDNQAQTDPSSAAENYELVANLSLRMGKIDLAAKQFDIAAELYVQSKNFEEALLAATTALELESLRGDWERADKVGSKYYLLIGAQAEIKSVEPSLGLILTRHKRCAEKFGDSKTSFVVKADLAKISAGTTTPDDQKNWFEPIDESGRMTSYARKAIEQSINQTFDEFGELHYLALTEVVEYAKWCRSFALQTQNPEVADDLLDAAEGMLIPALERSGAHFGKNHPIVGSLCLELYEVWQQQGIKGRGQRLVQLADQIYESHFGPDSFASAEARLASISSLIADGRPKQAKAELQRIFRIFDQTLQSFQCDLWRRSFAARNAAFKSLG